MLHLVLYIDLSVSGIWLAVGSLHAALSGSELELPHSYQHLNMIVL